MAVGEIILLYHFQDEEMLRKIKLVLLRLKMRIKMVEYKDYNKSLAYLLGMPAAGPVDESKLPDYEGVDMEAPMMIMKGLSGRRIDELLLALRKAGVPKIDYKAVVTEHNVHWGSMRLYQEIKEEHDKMTK